MKILEIRKDSCGFSPKQTQVKADTASEILEMRQHFSAFFLVSTKIHSLKTSQNLKANILRT
ncbi:MAG: hypothetical protein PUF31_09345, partial [Oscillospiraceae bacterium]|nr:hypothetical protein [Oscillospiraceae bacterium]